MIVRELRAILKVADPNAAVMSVIDGDAELLAEVERAPPGSQQDEPMILLRSEPGE